MEEREKKCYPRVDELTRGLQQDGCLGVAFRLWRGVCSDGVKVYAYALELGGEWRDLEATAKEARNRLSKALLQSERLECTGRMMSVVGEGYRIVYSIEGCRRHASHSVRLDGGVVKVEPLRRMGIYQCRRAMAKMGVAAESIERHMSDRDFRTHFADYAERYVAVYKWLTGRLVFKSDAARAQELIARGECESIEFKSALGGVHDDIFETVCSFANGRGGDVLLGVNDGGLVVGLPRDRLDAIKRDVKRACSAKGGLFSRRVPIGVQELILDKRRIVHVQVPIVRGGVAYKGVRYARRGDADLKCRQAGDTAAGRK